MCIYNVPDEGSLLPKYRDCTTSNDFELYIYIYVYIYIYTYIYIYIYIYIIYIYITTLIQKRHILMKTAVLYIYIYNSKSLDVVQSLYFGSKLPSSGTYK